MTDLDGTLAELARLRSGSEPIVSLYLDVRWRDEQRREQVRLFVRDGARAILGHYAEGAPGRAELARTLEKVTGARGGAHDPGVRGGRATGSPCSRASRSGLWRPLFFGRPFADELSADGVPHLGQLARLAAEVVPAIVVVPSKDGADVYEVRLGEVETEASVGGPVPRSDAEKLSAGTGAPGRQTSARRRTSGARRSGRGGTARRRRPR